VPEVSAHGHVDGFRIGDPVEARITRRRGDAALLPLVVEIGGQRSHIGRDAHRFGPALNTMSAMSAGGAASTFRSNIAPTPTWPAS